jgi:hypothetical protein
LPCSESAASVIHFDKSVNGIKLDIRRNDILSYTFQLVGYRSDET